MSCAMLRTLSVARSSLRSSRKILTSLSSPPPKFWATSLSPPPPSSSSCSYSSKQGNDGAHEAVSFVVRDTATARPPRLLVVQPRLRPEKFLQAKLNEALCLANSLEEQRDGYFHTDFFDKGLPPHLVVQNPSIKGHKARAGFARSIFYAE